MAAAAYPDPTLIGGPTLISTTVFDEDSTTAEVLLLDKSLIEADDVADPKSVAGGGGFLLARIAGVEEDPSLVKTAEKGTTLALRMMLGRPPPPLLTVPVSPGVPEVKVALTKLRSAAGCPEELGFNAKRDLDPVEGDAPTPPPEEDDGDVEPPLPPRAGATGNVLMGIFPRTVRPPAGTAKSRVRLKALGLL